METTVKILGVVFNLGDLATWITGIITFFLFIIAFWQINHERRMRNDQKKYEQAEKIACWFVTQRWDGNSMIVWVALNNQSVQPVYQVVVSVFPILQSDKKPEQRANSSLIRVGTLPPGTGYTYISGSNDPSYGVEMGFKDIYGNNWIRRVDGVLVQIKEQIDTYYKITPEIELRKIINELPNNIGMSSIG